MEGDNIGISKTPNGSFKDGFENDIPQLSENHDVSSLSALSGDELNDANLKIDNSSSRSFEGEMNEVQPLQSNAQNEGYNNSVNTEGQSVPSNRVGMDELAQLMENMDNGNIEWKLPDEPTGHNPNLEEPVPVNAGDVEKLRILLENLEGDNIGISKTPNGSFKDALGNNISEISYRSGGTEAGYSSELDHVVNAGSVNKPSGNFHDEFGNEISEIANRSENFSEYEFEPGNGTVRNPDVQDYEHILPDGISQISELPTFEYPGRTPAQGAYNDFIGTEGLPTLEEFNNAIVPESRPVIVDGEGNFNAILGDNDMPSAGELYSDLSTVEYPSYLPPRPANPVPPSSSEMSSNNGGTRDSSSSSTGRSETQNLETEPSYDSYDGSISSEGDFLPDRLEELNGGGESGYETSQELSEDSSSVSSGGYEAQNSENSFWENESNTTVEAVDYSSDVYSQPSVSEDNTMIETVDSDFTMQEANDASISQNSNSSILESEPDLDSYDGSTSSEGLRDSEILNSGGESGYETSQELSGDSSSVSSGGYEAQNSENSFWENESNTTVEAVDYSSDVYSQPSVSEDNTMIETVDSDFTMQEANDASISQNSNSSILESEPGVESYEGSISSEEDFSTASSDGTSDTTMPQNGLWSDSSTMSRIQLPAQNSDYETSATASSTGYHNSGNEN